MPRRHNPKRPKRDEAQLGDGLTFGECPDPDCGILLSVEVNEDRVPVAVIHMVPTCPTFDRMTADQYLDWVLRVREAERKTAIQE